MLSRISCACLCAWSRTVLLLGLAACGRASGPAEPIALGAFELHPQLDLARPDDGVDGLARYLLARWIGSGLLLCTEPDHALFGAEPISDFIDVVGSCGGLPGACASIRTLGFRTNFTPVAAAPDPRAIASLIQRRQSELDMVGDESGGDRVLRDYLLVRDSRCSVECEQVILRAAVGADSKRTNARPRRRVSSSPFDMEVKDELWRLWIEGALFDLRWESCTVQDARRRLQVYLDAGDGGRWTSSVNTFLERLVIPDIEPSKQGGATDASESILPAGDLVQLLTTQRGWNEMSGGGPNPLASGPESPASRLISRGRDAFPAMRLALSDTRFCRVVCTCPSSGIRLGLWCVADVAAFCMSKVAGVDLPARRWCDETVASWLRRAHAGIERLR